MSQSPTRAAEENFKRAGSYLITTWVNRTGDMLDTVITIGMGLSSIAVGLKDLSIGLRATYQKLEEIEALLKRQNGPPFR